MINLTSPKDLFMLSILFYLARLFFCTYCLFCLAMDIDQSKEIAKQNQIFAANGHGSCKARQSKKLSRIKIFIDQAKDELIIQAESLNITDNNITKLYDHPVHSP